MARFVVRGHRARQPTPALLRVARRHADHYLAVHARIMAQPVACAALVGHVDVVRRSVRSAAIRVSVTAVYRDALQRIAVWFMPPAFLVAATVTAVFTTSLWPAPPTLWQALLAATVSSVATFGLLIVAVVFDRRRAHFTVTVVLAGVAVAAFPWAAEAALPVRLVLVASLTPVTMYAVAVPVIVLAYVCAWWLGAVVDARARIVLGLLQCTGDAATNAAWRVNASRRDDLGGALERVARTAESDLPRMLRRRTRDRATRQWLVARARQVATRIRACKRRVFMPSGDEALQQELAHLLLRACQEEWDSFKAEPPPPRGLGRRAAQRLLAAALLVTAGFLLPLHPVLIGPAGDSLRTALVIAGILALVPLPRDTLNRIPDTFVALAR